MAFTKCKGCGEPTENLSGWCNAGICSLKEEGYLLAWKELSSRMLPGVKDFEEETGRIYRSDKQSAI
jgi:hypothetical protein